MCYWFNKENLKRATSDISTTFKYVNTFTENLSNQRVSCMSVLGFTFDEHLSPGPHIDATISKAHQRLYGIKILKNYGASSSSLNAVFNAVIFSILVYAVPAWWGFANRTQLNKFDSILKKAHKWGYLTTPCDSFSNICTKLDKKLFTNILSDQNHVLHPHLPPTKPANYNLRTRVHNRTLPHISNQMLKNSFFPRNLYDGKYWCYVILLYYGNLQILMLWISFLPYLHIPFLAKLSTHKFYIDPMNFCMIVILIAPFLYFIHELSLPL